MAYRDAPLTLVRSEDTSDKIMRIIAFTDIHGAFNRVLDILQRESQYDVILIGGDLTTHGTAREATDALERIRQFKKPLFAVAGNMDLPSFETEFTKLGVNINAKGMLHEDIGFFGIAGSPFTPMHTPYEISEDEIQRRAESGWRDIQAARVKVFVPHAPPRDTKLDKIFLGKHVGSTAVRDFVLHNQPDVLICGHIHEARGEDVLGNTKLVNCGAASSGYYAVIDIQNRISITLRG